MLNIRIDGKFIPKESILCIDTDASRLVGGEEIKECRIYLKSISGGMEGGFGGIEPYYIAFTVDEDIERLKESLKFVMQGNTLIKNFIIETPEQVKTESDTEETETVTCDCLGSFIVDKTNKNYPIVQCPFCEKEFRIKF